jgi:hypothetical protein
MPIKGLLHPLRTLADGANVGIAARRTGSRDVFLMTAMMTTQSMPLPVQG